MSDKNSLLGMANYGTPATPSVSEQKKQDLAARSDAKKAMLGDSFDLFVGAVAAENGNQLAEQGLIKDLETLTPLELHQKYGPDVARNAHRYYGAKTDLSNLQNAKRDFGDAAGDFAADVRGGLGNMAIGAAALAAGGYDLASRGTVAAAKAVGLADEDAQGTNLSGPITEFSDNFSRHIQASKTPLAQERTNLHALQNQLNEQDIEADYTAGKLGEGFTAKLAREGEKFFSAVDNYADDPIMLSKLGAEGAGSMIPSTAAIQAVGKARALTALGKQGMGKDQALAYLASKEGKELLARETHLITPAVISATEAGGSFSEAQARVLAMDEEALSASPQYQDLRSQGMSHGEAQRHIALNSGLSAAVFTAAGAALAGRVAARFEANPLKSGSVQGAVQNIAAETVEEGLQSVNSAASGNAALNTSAGLEVDLIEGTGQALAEGALGGALTAGALQAPSTALHSSVATLKGTGKFLGAAYRGAKTLRENRIARSLDKNSPVGSQAQAESAAAAVSAAAEILETAPQDTAQAQPGAVAGDATHQTTPNQNAPASQPDVVRNTVIEAMFLAPEEAEGYASIYPNLAQKVQENPDQPVDRPTALRAFGEVLTAPDMDPAGKFYAALDIVAGFEGLEKLQSSDMEEAVSQLPEGDKIRQNRGILLKETATLHSSGILAKAQEELKSLTPEALEQYIDFSDLRAGNLDSPAAQGALQTLEVIGRYNPAAVNQEQYGLVLNQSYPKGLSQKNQLLIKSLETSRKIAEEFEKLDEAKAEIAQEQDAVIESLDPSVKTQAKQRRHKPQDIVRQEVNDRGNSDNRLPSLSQHRANVASALASGRREDAAAALVELRNFALSQINKLGAINKSAAEGRGKKYSYQAYNGSQFFEQTEFPVYANRKSFNSVALAKDVRVDAAAAASLFNILRETYAEELGSVDLGPALTVPELHESMQGSRRQAQETPAAQAPQPAPEPVAERVVEPEPEPAPVEPVADEKPAQPADEQKPAEGGVSEKTPLDSVAITVEEAANKEEKAEPTPTVADVSEPAAQVTEPEEDVQPADQATATDLEDSSDDVDNGTEPEPVNAVAGWFESITDALVRVKSGANHFLDSFKPAQEGSTFLYHEDPTQYLSENLERLVEVAANELPFDLTDDQVSELRDLLDGTLPALVQGLDAMANEAANKTRGGKKAGSKPYRWSETIVEGADVLSYDNGISLNLAVQNEDGSYSFEPQVARAAVMSAVEWMMTQNVKGLPKLDREKVARIFKVKEHQVTANMMKVANSGLRHQQALDGIADRMMALLGVAPKSEASITYTQGIFRAMAANTLEMMRRGGMVTVDKTTVELPGKDKKTGKAQFYNYISVMPKVETAGVKELLKAFETLPDVFTQTFVPGAQKMRYIGKPPAKISRTQKRNKFGTLSAKELQAAERMQNSPNRMNMPVVNFTKAFTPSNLLRYLGYVEGDITRFNKVHAESIKGRNTSLTNGIKGAFAYLDAVEAAAAQEGKDPSEVPIYFSWRVSRVGRLQQEGPITPQGDKIAREMITTTNAVLDLTDPEMDDLFWLTVAQSLGLSLEKRQHSEILPEIKSMMDDPGMAKALDILGNWLDAGQDTELSKDQQKEFLEALRSAKDAKGEPIEATMKAFHAVVAVARYEQALRQGGEAMTAFETSLALEADGKTDGPINAIMHMSTGAFTQRQIDTLAKGGLFFTDQGTTLNDHIAQDKEDLYQVTATIFEKMLAHRIGTDPIMQGVGPALLSVLDQFLPSFSFKRTEDDKMELEVGRNVTKNPLTVFLYGSGVNGIASKISGAMMDEFYSALSEVSAGIKDGSMKSWRDHPKFRSNPEMVRALEFLLSHRFRSKNGGITFDKRSHVSLDALLKDTPKTELDVVIQDNLTSAVEHLFATTLTDAIDAATGGLRDNMQTIQKASQAQTIIFQEIFKQKIAALQGKDKLVLSQKAFEDAFEETMKLAPVYETDAQSFHISAARPLSNGRQISTALEGGLGAEASTLSPQDAGVKVSPYMVIGTGDGRMILNIYVNADGDIDTSLAVFDGVELAADKVRTGSEQINKAVYDGWMEGNIFEAMHESFERFMPHLDLSKVSPEARAELQKIFDTEQPVTQRDFVSMRNQLQRMSAETKARKRAIQKMAVSVDHMASAMAPHQSEGLTVPSEELLGTLNKLYERELEKLRKEARELIQRPDVEGISPEIQDHLDDYAVKDVETGVQTLSGTGLQKMFRSLKGIPKEAHSVLRSVLGKNGSKLLDRYTVHFGSSAALEQLRDEQYPHLTKQPIRMGQMFPDAKVMFIANVSGETLVHEVVHAVTVETLRSYYQNPEQAPEHIRDAVKRIEILQDEFLSMDFSAERGNLRRVAEHLQDMLTQHKDDPLIRSSEFLAWMLSNQNLLDLGQRTKVYNPLLRLAAKALNALKTLLGLNSTPGRTMFTHLRFNTAILAAGVGKDTVLTEQDVRTGDILEQTYGADARLDALETRYIDRLYNFLVEGHAGQTREDRAQHIRQAHARAQAALNHVSAQGFNLNFRQAQVFRSIHAAMTSDMRLNPSAMREINRLYGHAVKTLTVEDFLEDPENHDDIEFSLAHMKHDVLTGVSGLRKTADGRSDLLATFVALAQADDQFRSVLAKLQTPKDVQISDKSVDGMLNSLAEAGMNALTHLSVSRKRRKPDVAQELDVLTEVLAEIQGQSRMEAVMNEFKVVDRANDYVAGKLSSASKKAVRWAQDKRESATSQAAKGGYAVAEFISSLGNKEDSAAAGEALNSLLNLNDRFRLLRETLADIRGMTASNQELIMLLNPARAQVDAIRQDFREIIPGHLASHFKRKLKRQDWQRLFMGIGRADILALERSEALELMGDPSKVDAMVQETEEALQRLDPDYHEHHKTKSEALAEYMVHRKVTTTNLLRNAAAIASQWGEVGAEFVDVTPELVQTIDRLVSLYAFQKLDDATKETLSDLAQNEAAAMKELVGFHEATRRKEKERAGEDGTPSVARNNGWKGYVPSVSEEGHAVIVADDAKHDALVLKGFTRIGDYNGDPREGYRGRRGYYQSSVAGQAQFRQGVAQSVHTTYQGVDVRTGQTRSGEVAGMVVGREAKRIIQRYSRNQDGLVAGEYLMPIYDADGKVYAYERPVAPERLVGLNQDMNLARMLGVWAGRIAEELAADDMNRALVKTLKRIHDAEGVDRAEEYVNIADPDNEDPIIRDAWATMGWKIKRDAAEVFGEKDYFPVRRDMVNDALGYRAATVTDPWTGVSRWSPEVQKGIVDTATLIMGKNAFKWLRQGEKLVTTGVSYAKSTIIIRSMVIPVGNIISNVGHLAILGLNPLAITRGMRDKFVEITQYTKNRDEIIRLKADLTAAVDDPLKGKRLKARIQALEDANAKLSIHGLIEAGEFSTISESLTEADLAIREGSFSDYIEKAVDKLPDWSKTVGKNLLITKDTALFQGLNRMVQYGDFVAKAVLYDHLTRSKGMEPEEALREISEEFVNYNRLPGRGRDFLETMGLMWFYNYKLRILKIAAKTLRERPVSALTLGLGVAPPLDVDTVLGSNLVTTVTGGNMGYTLGWGMGLDAGHLNPWYALTK